MSAPPRLDYGATHPLACAAPATWAVGCLWVTMGIEIVATVVLTLISLTLLIEKMGRGDEASLVAVVLFVAATLACLALAVLVGHARAQLAAQIDEVGIRRARNLLRVSALVIFCGGGVVSVLWLAFWGDWLAPGALPVLGVVGAYWGTSAVLALPAFCGSFHFSRMCRQWVLASRSEYPVPPRPPPGAPRAL